MIIFGVGYVAVFGVFVLLYWHAYRRRSELELNELEVFDTRADVSESAVNVGIGAVSITMALLGGGRFAGLAGMTYMLCPIVLTLHGIMMGKRRRKIEKRFSVSGHTALESN
jgi:hypothetical protein